MSIRKLISRAGITVVVAAVAWLLPAQGPISDKVEVNFPNPVIVAGERLPAGDYTIRQVDSASNSRLLAFATEDGTRHELLVSAMPAVNELRRRDTSVILEQRGNDYYLSQIWIEGKDYGYEFPTPVDVPPVEARVGPLQLAATYTPVEERVEVTPPPPPPPVVPPTPEPEERVEVTPPPPPPPVMEPEPVEPLPVTAAYWAGMLLAGFGLTAAGLVLRRKQ
jgi:hypothetical protein